VKSVLPTLALRIPSSLERTLSIDAAEDGSGRGDEEEDSAGSANSKDSTYTASSNAAASPAPRRVRKRAAASDSPPIDAVFRASRIVDSLGSGRIGHVFKYLMETKQQIVAVKLVDTIPEGNDAAFERELQTYRLLEDLQGKVVPQLFGVMEAPSGMRRGIVLQLLDGMSDDFKSWEVERLRSAKKILLMLLTRFGIQHNDVRGANFGIDKKSGRLMVFDFEDVTMGISSDSDVKRCKQSIRRALGKCCRSNSWNLLDRLPLN